MAKSRNNGNGSGVSAEEIKSKLMKAGFGKGVILQLLKQYGPQILALLFGFLNKDPNPPPVMMKARKASCEPRECNEDECLCAQMIAHAQVACLEGDHECCLQNLVCALHCSVQCCCPDADTDTDTEDEDSSDDEE